MKLTQRAFVRRYPLQLREVIAAPMIVHGNVPGFSSLPFPRVEVIRDLARFAGFGDGALRTALSRARASGRIEAVVDPTGVTRFRLTETQRSVSSVVQGWHDRPEGFLVAVFSFHAREEMKRRAVRDILTYFGFKRIAQNSYVNGIIETGGLMRALEHARAADRCYIFRCPSVDDQHLLDRLNAIFDVQGRARVLARFHEELRAFLEEPGMDPMETGRRVFYAGPAHHRQCFVEEPPIPVRVLPPEYPLPFVREYLVAFIQKRMPEIVTYYRTLCG